MNTKHFFYRFLQKNAFFIGFKQKQLFFSISVSSGLQIITIFHSFSILLHFLPLPKTTCIYHFRSVFSTNRLLGMSLITSPLHLHYLIHYWFPTQLEMVQREGLSVHMKSITPENCLTVSWMNYPENASIIDAHEQQYDYYDRYNSLFLRSSSLAMSGLHPLFHLTSFPTHYLGQKQSPSS